MKSNGWIVLGLLGLGAYILHKRGGYEPTGGAGSGAPSSGITTRQLQNSALAAEGAGVGAVELTARERALFEGAGIPLTLGGVYEPAGFTGENPLDPYRVYMISPEQLAAEKAREG